MVLDAGDSVPRVSATNQDGKRITIEFEAPTVLYFYPQDGSSGCTTEAQNFDGVLDSYHEAGVDVYGISTDDVDSHRAFAAENDLGFDLLADPDAKVAGAFDVPVSNGRAERTTFVCAGGQVCGVYEGIHYEGHARSVLGDMINLGLVSL